MTADHLVVNTPVASTKEGIACRRLGAVLEEQKPTAVLQRKAADAIGLLYEIATHRNVIEACFVSMSHASRTVTLPVGLFGVT